MKPSVLTRSRPIGGLEQRVEALIWIARYLANSGFSRLSSATARSRGKAGEMIQARTSAEAIPCSKRLGSQISIAKH